MTAGRAACLIADLDGTLIRGGRVVAGAMELLDLFGDRSIIVSNNSTHSAHRLAGELRAAGLIVPEERLVLAGMIAIETIARDYADLRALVVGAPDLEEAAESAGLRLADERIELVLLGRDETFTYRKLTTVVDAVAGGAILVATNPDLSHPGGEGWIVPETGALLAAVLACVTPRVLRVIGKPEPALFAEALRRLGADPKFCLVVGDNPDTDIAGAERFGMPSVLVEPAPSGGAPDLSSLIAGLVSSARSD